MEQYKLEISEQGRENIEETIATLIEAAQEIANLSEKDFNKVKSKKWYKRLWDVITCYKDNQKLTARGVANLAKLKEIVMKAIVILARYSADTAALVSESLQKIENLEDYLGQMTSGLSKVALEVKKLKFNYKKSLTISDLNVQERDIVGSIFVKYVKKCHAEGKRPTSASQKLYSFAMEGDTPEEDIDISTHLDLLNTDVQQLLFRLNQSYYYLVAGEFDDSDYFDDFEVSNKNKKAILSQIEDAVLFSGAENYTDTLLPNEEVYFIDSDNVEFEVTDVEEDSGNQNSSYKMISTDDVADMELTETKNIIYSDRTFENAPKTSKEGLDFERGQGGRELFEFTSLFVNPKGETLTLCSKDIHMRSICSCKGRIILKNCRIIYNEESDGNAFSLETGAVFSAENCVFIDAGYNTVPFIKTNGSDINLNFRDCLFIDCTHFIEADDSASVLISGCELENCNQDFAVCKNSHFKLNESKVVFTDKYEKKTHTMIDATDVLIYTDNCTGNIKAVQYVGKKETDICIFAKGLTIEDCSFQDLSCPIEECEEIKNSTFINCSGAIGNKLNNHSTLFGLVDNCNFFHCANTIHNAKVVKNCRFESNFGTAITSQYSEGFVVSKCLFKGIDGTDADKPIICYCVGEEMQVTVEKCVFEDCCFGTNWCIGPKSDGMFIERPKNPSVDIKQCSFKNCSADNAIQGAYVYPGPLYRQRASHKSKPVYDVIHIIECKGCSDDIPCSKFETAAEKAAILFGFLAGVIENDL